MKLISKKFNEKSQIILPIIGVCFVQQFHPEINDDIVEVDDIYYPIFKEIKEACKEEFPDLELVSDSTEEFKNFMKENSDIQYRVLGTIEETSDDHSKPSIRLGHTLTKEEIEIIEKGGEEAQELRAKIYSDNESRFKPRSKD